jgi:uncharacterized membrane protein
MAGDNEDRIAAALEGLQRQMGELSQRIARLEGEVQQQKKDWKKTAEVQHVASTPAEPLDLKSPEREQVSSPASALPGPALRSMPEQTKAPEPAVAAHAAPPPPLSIQEEAATRQAETKPQVHTAPNISAVSESPAAPQIPSAPPPPQRAPVQPVRPVSSRAADFVARQQEAAAASYVADASATNYQQRPEPEPAKERLEYAPPAEYRKPPEPKGRWSLEQALGKNWAAWIGGVVVVLGMLFFLKYAWDQGWIRPTPAMRVWAGIIIGAVFCGVGEWMHRKKIAVLAATLHGVGLATVMASIFAAYAAFEPPVFSRNGAFIGVLVTGVIGILLSMHIKQMTLTILALVGMYISPAVLSSGQDSSVGFMTYLCVVAALGIVVSILRPKWIAVRWVAFSGTWIWTLLWVVAPQTKILEHVTLAFAAPGILLLMYLAETVVRVRSARTAAAKEQIVKPDAFIVPDSQGALALFLDTCAILSVQWLFFNRTGLPNLFVVPLVLAGVNVAMFFATPAKLVKMMAAMLACALVTLAVPLYFQMESITIAWAVMSLVVAIYAMVSGHVAARIWSVGLYFLVVVRLVGYDSLNEKLTSIIGMIGRMELTWWIIMGWGVAVFGVVLARIQAVALAKARSAGDDAARHKVLRESLDGAPRVTSAVAVLVLCFVGAKLMMKAPEATLAHALVLAIFGCGARDVFARWAATVVLCLATFVIFSAQWRDPEMQKTVATFGTFAFTRWMFLAWSAALLAIGFAALARMVEAIREKRAVKAGEQRQDRTDLEFTLWRRASAIISVIIISVIGLLLMQKSTAAAMAHAVVLATIGVVTRDVIARWAATGLLGLVALYMLGNQWQSGDMREVVLSIGGLVISKWLLTAWCIAFLALIFSMLARVRTWGMETGLKETNAYAATAIFFIASTMHFMSLEGFNPFSSVTLAGACWTLGLFILSKLIRDKVYKDQVLVLAGICLAKWALVDGLAGSATYSGPPIMPVIHLFSLSGLIIAAVVFFVELPASVTREKVVAIKAWIIGPMAFLWINLEALRVVDFVLKGATTAIGSPWIVKNVTLSVLWACVGFTCIISGFVRKHASMRWTGLIMLGVTVIKVLLVDMANVHTVLRIVSFVVTGLLLLGVSYIYHKASAKERIAAEAERR